MIFIALLINTLPKNDGAMRAATHSMGQDS